MIERQASRCPRPDASARVLAKFAHAGAGQAFGWAVLDPGPAKITVQPAIRGHPDAPISARNHLIDSIKATSQFRPLAPVKFPDFVQCSAPKFAFGGFHEAKASLRRGFVAGRKHSPFLFMTPGNSLIAAQPQISVAR